MRIFLIPPSLHRIRSRQTSLHRHKRQMRQCRDQRKPPDKGFHQISMQAINHRPMLRLRMARAKYQTRLATLTQCRPRQRHDQSRPDQPMGLRPFLNCRTAPLHKEVHHIMLEQRLDLNIIRGRLNPHHHAIIYHRPVYSISGNQIIATRQSLPCPPLPRTRHHHPGTMVLHYCIVRAMSFIRQQAAPHHTHTVPPPPLLLVTTVREAAAMANHQATERASGQNYPYGHACSSVCWRP